MAIETTYCHCNKPLMTDSLAPVWVRQGTILSGSQSWEDNSLEEPKVLERTTGCQIVSSPCLAMWYTGGGWGISQLDIGYAETTDLTAKTGWTKYSSNPVITNHARGFVLLDSGTFYEFCVNQANGNMDLYTSTDGISWSLNTANIVSVGSSGAWDDTAIDNSFVVNDSGTWDMIYEATNGIAFQCGVATAPSLSGPWVKNPGNPVLGTSPGCSGPQLDIVSGTYWVWGGVAIISASQGFGRWSATSLTGSYVENPPDSVQSFYNGAVFSAASSDEAPQPGGIADGYRLELSGSTYLFYSATNNEGADSGDAHIKLAIAPYTLSTLTTSIEGMTSSNP